MGHYTDQAAVIAGPTSTTKASVLANTAASVDLNSFAGTWVIIKSNVKTHYRFRSGATAVVTTNDIYMTADFDYPFYIPAGGARRYISHKGAGTGGSIYIAGPCSDALDV